MELRLKLQAYLLLIIACTIVPVIYVLASAYSELNILFQAINLGQGTQALEKITNGLMLLRLELNKLAGLHILLLVIIVTSAIFIINRIILNPVERLTSRAVRMTEGENDVQFPRAQQNEQNNAFDEMLLELQESEAQAKGVFNSVQDGLIIINGDGVIKAVNPALCELLGYQQNDLVAQGMDVLLPKSVINNQQNIMEFITAQTHSKNKYIQVDACCKNGVHIPVEISMSRLTTSDKIFIFIIVHDIREREKAERALMYERDRAQCYLDTVEVAIISIDTQGLISLVNRKCCELLGYSEEELLGIDYFGLCWDMDEAEELREAYNLHVTNNEILPKYFYVNLATKNGQKRIFEWHNNTIKDFESNTVGIILAGTDMTEFRKSIDERKALRERLHRAQKMEAIGQLSSGIAHDFNNILATMMGYTELLQDMLSDSDDSSIQKYLKEIYISGGRARDLIDDMLKYSRGTSNKPNAEGDSLYLPSIATDMVHMIKGVIPSSVEIATNIRQDTFPILMDSVSLQQIILNLCLNASNAIHNNGSLYVSTTNHFHFNGVCASCNMAFAGEFMELSITDNGVGLESEALSHLFEPFYTTKKFVEAGKTTGMGLAVVHGLVHDKNGHILVESKPGVGTTFRVFFQTSSQSEIATEA